MTRRIPIIFKANPALIISGILNLLEPKTIALGGINEKNLKKIIQIGILVTIIFDAGAREKMINQRVYLKKY